MSGNMQKFRWIGIRSEGSNSVHTCIQVGKLKVGQNADNRTPAAIYLGGNASDISLSESERFSLSGPQAVLRSDLKKMKAISRMRCGNSAVGNCSKCLTQPALVYKSESQKLAKMRKTKILPRFLYAKMVQSFHCRKVRGFYFASHQRYS